MKEKILYLRSSYIILSYIIFRVVETDKHGVGALKLNLYYADTPEREIYA